MTAILIYAAIAGLLVLRFTYRLVRGQFSEKLYNETIRCLVVASAALLVSVLVGNLSNP